MSRNAPPPAGQRSVGYRTVLLPRPDLVTGPAATTPVVPSPVSAEDDFGAGLLGRRAALLVAVGAVATGAVAMTGAELGLTPNVLAAWCLVVFATSIALSDSVVRRQPPPVGVRAPRRRALVVGHPARAAQVITEIDGERDGRRVAVAACLVHGPGDLTPPAGIPLSPNVGPVLAAVEELDVDVVVMADEAAVCGTALAALAQTLAPRVDLVMATPTAGELDLR